MNIISFSYSLITDSLFSFAETFHNTADFISYIFVVFSLNFFLILFVLLFNYFSFFFNSFEKKIKEKLVTRIKYWEEHKDQFSCYLFYIFFTDLAKVNFIISIFHFFFLFYLTYIVLFTDFFIVNNLFIYYYMCFLCIINFIFLFFNSYFSNRFFYWVLLFFFGCLNWILFFSYLCIYFGLCHFLFFKWFGIFVSFNFSDLFILYEHLVHTYVPFNQDVFLSFFIYFNGSSFYDVHLFFWDTFYSYYHLNPIHYYFILYFPLIRIPLFIFFSFFLHFLLVVSLNLFMYLFSQFYFFIKSPFFSFKRLYIKLLFFFINFFYNYIGLVLFGFYIFFFIFLFYFLSVSFTINYDSSSLSFCGIIPTMLDNKLFDFGSRLVTRLTKLTDKYFGSILNSYTRQSFVPPNGKLVYCHTDESLQKDQCYGLLELNKSSASSFFERGKGEFSHLGMRGNDMTYEIDFKLVGSKDRGMFGCSFDKNGQIKVDTMIGPGNTLLNSDSVYKSVPASISVKVEKHPLIVTSYITQTFKFTAREYSVLFNPALDKDLFALLIKKVLYTFLNDRSIFSHLNCVFPCSTSAKPLSFGEGDNVLLRCVALSAFGKPGSVQFSTEKCLIIDSRHIASILPRGNTVLVEEGMYHLLVNDPLFCFSVMEQAYNASSKHYVDCSPDAVALCKASIKAASDELDALHRDISPTSIEYEVSDIPQASRHNYVGFVIMHRNIPIEKGEFRFKSIDYEDHLLELTSHKIG